MDIDNRKEDGMEMIQSIIDYLSRPENTSKPKNGTRCVDGRYGSKEFGKVALPGGDMGLVMAVQRVCNELGLDITPVKVFKYVFDVVTKYRKFHGHTDEHSEHQHGIGCGHVNKATQDSDEYGVTRSQMEAAYAELQKLVSASDPRVEFSVLPGAHAERAVLIVKSSKTVNPNGKNKNGKEDMYFISDEAGTLALIKQLVRELKSVIPGLTVENLQAALSAQTNVTLHKLAEGKPIYEVDVDTTILRKVPTVRLVGYVQ